MARGRRSVLAAGVAAVLVTGGLAAAPAGATASTPTGTDETPVAAAALAGDAAEILRQINEARVAAGVRPVREDPGLSGPAQAWAEQNALQGMSTPDPDVLSKIPGSPVPDSTFAHLNDLIPPTGLGGSFAGADFVARISQDPAFYAPELTHVGVGWSVGQRSGVLQVRMVAYRFTDVGPSDAFYDEIEWFGESGITTGFPDGTFRPGANITREAMAAFLYRYSGGTEVTPCTADEERTFTDVPTSHPFCGYIEQLAAMGVVRGHADGTFRPGDAVSREALSAFLWRLTSGGEPDPACPTSAFRDVSLSSPFCGTIRWMGATGISTGWPDGTFRPSAPVERQAVAAFLERL